MQNTVKDVRDEFVNILKASNYVTDKSGCKMLEIIGQSFTIDPKNVEDYSIFGEINYDYIDRELDWYLTKSCNINAIKGEIPKIWKQVATPDGYINSNYGWVTFSTENGYNGKCQYEFALKALTGDESSRRSMVIYNRPTMQVEYNKGGMSDFMCTNAVEFLIRDNKLHLNVQMRSNDAWAGFRNDLQWHIYVMKKMCQDYNTLTGKNIELGSIHWQAASLHIYEKDFWRVEAYAKTKNHLITKAEYDAILEKEQNRL